MNELEGMVYEGYDLGHLPSKFAKAVKIEGREYRVNTYFAEMLVGVSYSGIKRAFYNGGDYYLKEDLLLSIVNYYSYLAACKNRTTEAYEAMSIIQHHGIRKVLEALIEGKKIEERVDRDLYIVYYGRDIKREREWIEKVNDVTTRSYKLHKILGIR